MDTNLLQDVLQRISTQFVENLETYIPVLAIILLGWLVARFIAFLVQRFIRRTGWNDAFNASPFAGELQKINQERTLAEIASRVTFWLLWFYIILATLTSSDLNLQTGPFADLLAFLPHLFTAFLILVGGVLLAQFIGHWVQVGVAATGVEFHETLGKGARLLLIIIVVITATEELGINLTPLTNALTNIITILLAGLALAFGLGARDVVRNILAGYYAREHFSLGDKIGIDGEKGILDAIGTVSAEIDTPNGRIIVPNTHLTEKEVKIYLETEE